MGKQGGLIPAVAVRGIATGLLMMAFFTLVWTGIAYSGMHGTAYAYLLIVFPLLAVSFVARAFILFKTAKTHPAPNEKEKEEGKKMGKWFGIIFGAEGVLIFLGVNVVINIGQPRLVIPVIALVVGLHFFPLAKVFKRTIDYYLAAWSTAIAVIAIILIINHTLSASDAAAFTGTGLAAATSCYGLFMIYKGNHLDSY
ncbi:MAG TPA: hypothetical protein VHA56_09030 [Mucilaginibacter sp.]|nr:hypothetical protein [Mucilaginibacter sp.]